VSALGESTWRTVARSRPLLAVPLGSCEQHGPHLPLDTDTRIASSLASTLAAALTDGGNEGPNDVVVAPALAYGASGEHAGFAGTLSLGTDGLEFALVELVRSADHFAGVVLVNGHGGNVDAIDRAVRTLRHERRKILAWSPPTDGVDAHAGRVETSVMLAIAPDLVRLEHVEAGCVEPLPAILPTMRARGVAAVSPNGVLGDPAGASAAEGRELLARWGADLVAAVSAWET
jgi:mycofactocin system creatininase family protein